jgi:hypothetical protein
MDTGGKPLPTRLTDRLDEPRAEEVTVRTSGGTITSRNTVGLLVSGPNPVAVSVGASGAGARSLELALTVSVFASAS